MATQEAPSANTPPLSRAPMTLVGERQTPDQTLSGLIAAQTTQTSSTPKPAVSRETGEYLHRAAWKAGVIGAFNTLAIILAIRLILLVAIVGAIALSVIAINAPDPYRLAALGIYSVVIVVPMVWLSSRK